MSISINDITAYDRKMFNNLTTKCKFYKWYDIDPNRNDYNEFVISLKKFIDCYGIAEFRDDTYTQFRLFYRENKVESYLSQHRCENPSVESTIYIQTDKVTQERNKLLTSSKLASDFKEIPCFRSRPDIGEKILREEAERKAMELKRTTEENDKQERIKAWKNG